MLLVALSFQGLAPKPSAIQHVTLSATSEPEAAAPRGKVTLLLEINPKQVGQLQRDWYAIIDVSDVRIGSAQGIGDQPNVWPHAGTAATTSARSAHQA